MKDKLKPSSKKKRTLVLGLISLAAGLVSYFGYRYWKTHHKKSSSPSGQSGKEKTGESNSNTTPRSSGQAKRSSSAPAKGDAPGTKAKPGLLKPDLIAGAIRAAITAKNFTRAYTNTKAIQSPQDYKLVNAQFQKSKTVGQTPSLAQALFTTFSTKVQRQALTKVFTTIGLKYDGKGWALSGIDDAPLIITTQTTKVWKDPQSFVEVPPNMVLGKSIAQRGTYTLFKNDLRYFLVETGAVKIYIEKKRP